MDERKWSTGCVSEIKDNVIYVSFCWPALLYRNSNGLVAPSEISTSPQGRTEKTVNQSLKSTEFFFVYVGDQRSGNRVRKGDVNLRVVLSFRLKHIKPIIVFDKNEMTERNKNNEHFSFRGNSFLFLGISVSTPETKIAGFPYSR